MIRRRSDGLTFDMQLSSRPAAELTLNDVSQQWTSLGLERQRLDDLLELVSMATPHPEGPPPMTSSSIVEWNKLLALAAGQLGNVRQTQKKLARCPSTLFIHSWAIKRRAEIISEGGRHEKAKREE